MQLLFKVCFKLECIKVLLFTKMQSIINSSIYCQQIIVRFEIGTNSFLTENPYFLEDDKSLVANVECNKETGGKRTLQCWSRGSFWIVTGGGIIEYFQPLYKYVFSNSFALFVSFNNELALSTSQLGLAKYKSVDDI